MTFLIDTNVLVYTVVPSRYESACAEILDAVVARRASGRVSTAILEELWHLELTGRLPQSGLARHFYEVFSPLIPVTDEVVAGALVLKAPRLGANDRIHVATALANGIDTIVSADASLDGLPGIRRVDPLDEVARTRMLSES